MTSTAPAPKAYRGVPAPVVEQLRPAATISIDLDPVDVHVRGYGHLGAPPDPLVHEVALPRLLEVLARHEVRATFFILAREVPSEVIKLDAIRAAGHEVASHGIDHLAGISTRTEDVIRAELEESRTRLQAAGQTVVGFRAPDWSAGRRLISALADTGYQYDASLMPSPFLPAGRLVLAMRARRGGDLAAVRPPPSFRRRPFRWSVGNSSVVEFPLAVSPRLRLPLYHTLRYAISDETFLSHLEGFVRRGESLSYALHGVDALGMSEDDVDERLGAHPGMKASLEAKLELLERTIGAIATRFATRTFADRLAEREDIQTSGRLGGSR